MKTASFPFEHHYPSEELMHYRYNRELRFLIKRQNVTPASCPSLPMLVLSSSLIHCIPALLTFLLFFFFTLGSKALDYSNGLFDCQSPSSPFMGNLRALHLLEDLRGILELLDNDGRNSLRCQIPDSTAESLVEWLQGRLVSASKPGIEFSWQ